MMIAFLPFKAFRVLWVGVATGFVEGVTAATTPTGLAILVIPNSSSSYITPPILHREDPSITLEFFFHS